MSNESTIEAGRDAAYLERVKQRHAARKNTARQLRIRQTALENGSWFFNALSVLTAAYFAVDMSANYSGVWAWLMGGALVCALILIEIAKRYTIEEGAEGKRIWFVPVAMLVAVSFYVSYHGGEAFTVEMAKAPETEHNPAIDSLGVRIAAVDADIANWKKQTWRGKIVTDARRSISKLEQTKIELIEQRTELERRELERNDRTENEHETELRTFGNVFGMVAGAADLLLIACLLIAKADEQAARHLLGLNEREREAQEKKEVKRPAPAPDTAPQPASVDIRFAEFARDKAREIAQLKAELETLRTEQRTFETVRANETERTNEQKAERTKPKKRTTKNATKAKTGRNLSWVPEAKRLLAQGKSYGEIAAIVGKSKSTVHKHVNG